MSAEARAQREGVAGLPAGALATLDQIASAVPSVATETGARALDLRAWGGLDVRLLPDRGFDLGDAWFGGVPLSWRSGVGERGPGGAWIRAWGGGLLITCGLRNVGLASEGEPQHGEFTHQPARDVAVARHADPDRVVLEAKARVLEADALAFRLEVERTVRTRTGEGVLEVHDVTRNLGSAPEPAPLLYHVNLGAPVWQPGATVRVSGGEVRPRDEDAAAALERWAQAPPVLPGAPERVFEHEVVPGPDGWASAVVTSPPTGLEVELRWDASTLPRFWQWVHPAPGISALGLEPANCSVLGRAADRAEGRLPVLEPGEERVTRFELRVRRI